MNRYFLFFLISCFLLFYSCTGNRVQPDPLFFDEYIEDDETILTYDEYTEDNESDSPITKYSRNVVKVPFKEDCGVRTLQVKINDCAEFPMIFDTGCSGVSISLLEFKTLEKHGYISNNDIVGAVNVQFADGSVRTEEVVNLRKIQIGDYVCYNVEATITENATAPLLLGNGALKDVKSFVVDDINNVIEFYLK